MMYQKLAFIALGGGDGTRLALIPTIMKLNLYVVHAKVDSLYAEISQLTELYDN
jgi:hypothetical protein